MGIKTPGMLGYLDADEERNTTKWPKNESLNNKPVYVHKTDLLSRQTNPVQKDKHAACKGLQSVRLFCKTNQAKQMPFKPTEMRI